mmetsp:Transcript_15309/g.18578  ORF Transcript_15309/g.18578 Transcript_15309/m.18578 type:complete len:422 (+) Transcript_15309:153-1418(+)|eukprot:CAMPEP_0184021368 /NCGR_PEP_ID=MMETSP0954-20121128/9889_1 /TAXON_ID=627963 /ORGANISM="Aplanochytrium sp, Strain PBS07" /LENGTH=421 /DNA_ID=CAMNT_0026303379 /DNA_START=164 /DNA_END=1429 /DNA_ORIENTATION=+
MSSQQKPPSNRSNDSQNSKIDEIVLQRQRSYKAQVKEVKSLEGGLEELLAVSMEAKKKNQIPRIIHKIWWQGLKELPEKYKKPLESWQMINPEWLIVIWDESAIFNMMEKYFPRYIGIMNDYPYMIQKIDAAKYFFLEQFGGMYSDMDQFCLREIEKFIDPETEEADFVCSLLTESRTMTMISSSFKFREGPYINNAFCVCKPQVEVWEDVRHRLASKRDSKGYQAKELCVLNTTGPVFFTKAIKAAIAHEKNLTKNDKVKSVRLIESKFIDPCSIYFKIGKEEHFQELLERILEEDEALCISFISSSWTNSLDAWYTPLLSSIVHFKFRKEFRKSPTGQEKKEPRSKTEPILKTDNIQKKNWHSEAQGSWIGGLGLSKDKFNSLLRSWKRTSSDPPSTDYEPATANCDPKPVKSTSVDAS